MKNIAVIGLGFGDEGKGLVTDWLCEKHLSENPLVRRFSGGHQVTHTVKRDKYKHIFANFGSGTLLGVPTYWDEACTIDPVGFMKEYQLLESKGITPKIYFHRDCELTTPYDIYSNRQSVNGERLHGTTGMGFYKTLLRKEEVSYSIKNIVNLLDKTSIGITNQVKQYLATIRMYYKNAGEDYELDETDFIQGVCFLAAYMEQQEPLDLYSKNINIYEGSQGLLLDKDIGFMPHCTPSNVDFTNLQYVDMDEVYLVTRGYQTRHGAGFMTNEHMGLYANNRDESNKANEYQGEFRKSVLDVDLLRYAWNKAEKPVNKATNKDVKINLVVTCLDQMNNFHCTNGVNAMCFGGKERFANYIKKELNIQGDVYISTGPTAANIIKVGEINE
jgi:adenylosuccinate synthase